MPPALMARSSIFGESLPKDAVGPLRYWSQQWLAARVPVAAAIEGLRDRPSDTEESAVYCRARALFEAELAEAQEEWRRAADAVLLRYTIVGLVEALAQVPPGPWASLLPAGVRERLPEPYLRWLDGRGQAPGHADHTAWLRHIADHTGSPTRSSGGLTVPPLPPPQA